MKPAKKVALKRSTEESLEVRHNEEDNCNTKDESLSQNECCPGYYWSEAMQTCIKVKDIPLS